MWKYICWNLAFKYKIQYEIQFFLAWQFARHTLQICKTKACLNQIILNNYHWFTNPNFACNALEYFKVGRQNSTCQSQNAICDTHSYILWMPKTVSQSMRIVSETCGLLRNYYWWGDLGILQVAAISGHMFRWYLVKHECGFRPFIWCSATWQSANFFHTSTTFLHSMLNFLHTVPHFFTLCPIFLMQYHIFFTQFPSFFLLSDT